MSIDFQPSTRCGNQQTQQLAQHHLTEKSTDPPTPQQKQPTMSKKQMTETEQEGYNAYWLDIEVDQNPYTDDFDSYWQWHTGWIRANKKQRCDANKRIKETEKQIAEVKAELKLLDQLLGL